MSVFLKGADLSTLSEVEGCGARFYDTDGREDDAMRILARHGVNHVRLRLWNDPRSAAGEPYGGGGCDLETVAALAGRAGELGLSWQLVFHYSDFWTDPGKQNLPKAWRGLGERELERAVYDFTHATLLSLRDRGPAPSLVSVGNEITNGLLWPAGKVPHWDTIARLVSAGIRAVRDTLPAAKTLIHLDNGGKGEISRDWFSHYAENGGEDFDCIGLSYYPYWSGTLKGLEENLHALASAYHKPLLVTETASGHTLADYGALERLENAARKGMAAGEKEAAQIPWPMTPAGQAAFLTELAALIRRVPAGCGAGFVYWEPAWLPVPGSGWATGAALRYLQDPGPGGNEWANQALFDYSGHALPAVEALARPTWSAS